jgi:hypothetical protein
MGSLGPMGCPNPLAVGQTAINTIRSKTAMSVRRHVTFWLGLLRDKWEYQCSKGPDPIIPAGGLVAKGAGNAGPNAANGLRLDKSLASQSQMSEAGTIMAGP